MSKQNRIGGDSAVTYRATFHRLGLSTKTLDSVCAMALERLRRQLGQRVRRELERMKRNHREVL